MLQRQSSFSSKESTSSSSSSSTSGPLLSLNLIKAAQNCSLEGLIDFEDPEVLLSDDAGLTCLHHACSGASNDSTAFQFV
jgi:hypothetical protein